MIEQNQNQVEKVDSIILFETVNKRIVQGQEHTKKIQKFITNMNGIIQKMGERLEMIQGENTKLTMKYNSFKEDNNKLIAQQVQKRTASHKQQFVSVDEIRALRVNIKEIQIKLKYKLEIKQFQQDLAKIKSDLSEAVNASIQRDQKCSKVVENTKEQLLKKDQSILQLLEFKDSILHDSIERANLNIIEKDSQLKGKIQKTKQELINIINQRQKNTSKKIDTIKQEFLQLTNKIVSDSLKRQIQITKNQSEQLKKVQKNTNDKFQQTNLSIEKINTRINYLTDKVNNELKNIKLNLNICEDREKQLGETAQEINQHITGIVEQYKNVKERFIQIQDQVGKIQKEFKQKINDKYLGELLGAGSHQEEQFNPKPKLPMNLPPQPDDNIKKLTSVRKSMNYQTKEQQSQEKEPERQKEKEKQKEKQKQKQKEPYQSRDRDKKKQEKIIKQIIQTDQPVGIMLQSPQVSKQQKRIVTFKDQYHEQYNEPKVIISPIGKLNQTNYQSDAHIKVIIHNLKLKIDQIQHNTSVIKEIIDSKANQSDLLKLHQSKLPKFALKELTKKLSLFKNVLEVTVPACAQILKEFRFEDNQLAATYSRLIKLKHDTKRNSEIQIDKTSTIYPSLHKSRRNNMYLGDRKGETISSHSSRMYQQNG